MKAAGQTCRMGKVGSDLVEVVEGWMTSLVEGNNADLAFPPSHHLRLRLYFIYNNNFKYTNNNEALIYT
jgi:hypothetical protein